MAKTPSPPPDVPDSHKVEPTKGFEKETRLKPPDQRAFEEYMEKPVPTGKEAPTGAITPMDLSQQRASMQQAAPTIDSILEQTHYLHSQYDIVNNQLNTPKLTLKNTHQQLLNNKLTEARSQIRSAAAKVHAPLTPETPPPSAAGPLAKLIHYATEGQNQLLAARDKLEELKTSGEEIQPGLLLLIQVKLSQAQQSIEYSSVLLSKVIDALKQTIGLQI